MALAFKNFNMANLLINNKIDKVDILEQSGVYELRCNDCNATYIGETGRQLAIRISEHKKNVTKSNMGKHLAATHHVLNDSNVKILHKTRKSALQLTWESYEIERAFRDNKVKCLNDRNVTNNYPLYMYSF